MLRRHTGVAVAALAVFAGPLAAQEVTCDDIVFDDAAMAVYPRANDACLAVVFGEDGARYVVMKAEVRQTANVNTVTLAFQHQDGEWGEPVQVTVSEDFRVMVGGEAKHVRDLVMGEQINVFAREGRWTVAMADVEVMEVPEEFHTEIVVAELEVIEEPAPEAEAPAAEAPAEAAPAEAAPAEAAPAEEAPAEMPAQEAPAGGLNWFWLGVLLVAVIVVFVFISKKKKSDA